MSRTSGEFDDFHALLYNIQTYIVLLDHRNLKLPMHSFVFRST